MIRSGMVVCACSDESETCITLVREWCKGCGYMGDDVRIVKRNGQIIAEAKRDLGMDFGDVIE